MQIGIERTEETSDSPYPWWDAMKLEQNLLNSPLVRVGLNAGHTNLMSEIG